MKTAQDYLDDSASGWMRSGFNCRLHGQTLTECIRGVPQGWYWGQMYLGWDAADKLIREGKIFYVHMFDRLQPCTLWPKWWEIKVYKDGDAWCCVGDGFENLQASDNFAFGDTREQAIENYKGIMVNENQI